MTATVHSCEPQLESCSFEPPEPKPRHRHHASLRISVLKKKLKVSLQNEVQGRSSPG